MREIYFIRGRRYRVLRKFVSFVPEPKVGDILVFKIAGFSFYDDADIFEFDERKVAELL